MTRTLKSRLTNGVNFYKGLSQNHYDSELIKAHFPVFISLVEKAIQFVPENEPGEDENDLIALQEKINAQ